MALSLVFVAHPRWVGHLTTTFPDPDVHPSWRADVRVLMWIQAWTSHALLTAPDKLLDANIYHPSARALTQSDHYLGTQLLALPIYALTRNPVLVTNLCALAAYVGSAAAAAALLAGCGAGLLPSIIAGLLAAFGATLVPANPHRLIQHPSALPLAVWLSFDASVGPAGRRSPVWLAATLLLAFIWSSYAAMLTVGLVVALLAELVLARRWVAVQRFTTAAIVPLAVLGVVFLPLLGAARQLNPAPLEPTIATVLLKAELRSVASAVSKPTLLLLALTIVPAVGWGGRRDIVHVGLALIVLTFVAPVAMNLGARWWSLLRFARYTSRFVVLGDIGAVVLIGYGTHELLARVPNPLVLCVAAVAVAAAAISTRLVSLAAYPVAVFPREPPPVYRWLAAHGDGRPLLEWPYPGISVDLGPGAVTQAEAMLMSTFHWLPLLNGYSGYPPPWRSAMGELIQHMTEAERLQDLVNMTGLRWILWHEGAETTEAPPMLAGNRYLEEVGQFDGIHLYRVTLELLHEDFSRALRWWSGQRSYLGASLDPLEPDDCRARLTTRSLTSAGGAVEADLAIANPTQTQWAAAAWSPRTLGTVAVETRWRCVNGRDQRRTANLPRDVRAGETVDMVVRIPTPAEYGPCALDLAVAQEGGCTLTVVSNAILVP